MSCLVTLCSTNPKTKAHIKEEAWKAYGAMSGTKAQKRAMIEHLRGFLAADDSDKKAFAESVFNRLKDEGRILDWTHTGNANRYDYRLKLLDGGISVVELKGGMDGNSANISERPDDAREFVVWSMCPNLGTDPNKGVWSGIHSRIFADMVDKNVVVDGVAFWDELCGSKERPCPKLSFLDAVPVEVGGHLLPAPCIFMFPKSLPRLEGDRVARPQPLSSVGFLQALHESFLGMERDVNHVTFEIEARKGKLMRKTTIVRDGRVVRQSRMTETKREGARRYALQFS